LESKWKNDIADIKSFECPLTQVIKENFFSLSLYHIVWAGYVIQSDSQGKDNQSVNAATYLDLMSRQTMREASTSRRMVAIVSSTGITSVTDS
jgi:uncharacterized membrane protein